MRPDWSHPELRDRPLLVAIDFGTAFSAIAHTIGRHPAAGRPEGLPLGIDHRPKPTAVRFQTDPQVNSQLAWNNQRGEWVFGNEVDSLVERRTISEADRFQMIKLCLDTSIIRHKVKSQLDRLQSLAHERLGPDHIAWPERLVSLYLNMLWKKAKSSIINAYHCSHGNIFDHRNIEVWLSVPKLWTPQIKEMMVRSAERAALPGSIYLVLEPEACAVACMAEEHSDHLRAFEGLDPMPSTRSSVLILDAGAGTVDIVTYRLDFDGRNLNIEEGVRGTADLCGSAVLNENFLPVFEKCLGRSGLYKVLQGQRRTVTRTNETAVFNAAVKSFEQKKKRFGDENDSGEPMLIEVPGLDDTLSSTRSVLGAGGIHIPRPLIRDLFDEIIELVLGMLVQQITSFNEKFGSAPETRLDRIIFVGGFSENEYVNDRLVGFFSGPGSLAGYNIQITRPAQQPRSTIVAHGALLRALSNPVTARTLTQSYGFSCWEDYDEGLHGSKALTWSCPFEPERVFVGGRIRWGFKVGEVVGQNEPPFRFRGHRDFDPNGPFTAHETLYRSFTETRDPVYTTTSGIVEVGSLVWVFSHIDLKHLEILTVSGTGRKYVRLVYELQIAFDGLRLTYSLIVPKNGRWRNWQEETEAMTDEQWGPNPYQAKCTLENLPAAFDVSGYRVRSNSTPV